MTCPFGVIGDRSPNASQQGMKTCTVGPSKSPESGDAQDVSVAMSAQRNPPFKACSTIIPGNG